MTYRFTGFFAATVFFCALNHLGCQGHKKDSDNDNGSQLTKTRLNEPDRLALTDANCQVQNDSLALTRRPVNQVLYGEQIRQLTTMRQSNRQVTLTQDVSLIHEAMPMKRCGLAPNTLDDVANTVLTQLEVAMNFYGSLASEPHPASFALNLHPFYEVINSTIAVAANGQQKTQETSGFMTDNASWSHAGGVTIFTLFPQSQKGRTANEKPVWQFPAVLSHEFGHQVFFDHFKAVFEDSSNDFLSTLQKTPYGMEQMPTPLRMNRHTLQASGEASLGDAIVAVNEGIADLFGFAATGAKPKAIDLPCFAQTRDLTSATLANGRNKIIDKDALTEFATQRISGALDSCSNLAEPHIFGATLSYSVLQFWSHHETLDPSRMGSLILKWLEQMNRNYEAGRHGSLFFVVFAAQSGIEAQLEPSATLAEAQCQAIASLMPGLQPYFAELAKAERFPAYGSCL